MGQQIPNNSIGLPNETYKKYKTAGYTDAQMTAAIKQRQEAAQLQASVEHAKNTALTGALQHAQHSMFAGGEQDNLIKWQLELDSILERIEHMLRGDRITYKDGNTYWMACKDNSERPLNDFGVSEVLKIISCYLNRNTILSNYDEATINAKVFDLGIEVSDFIFMKYEAMGMDNIEKRKMYPLLVREIVDMSHSAYLRALNGGERDSLREARQITQSENVNPMGQMQMYPGMMPRERSMLNPMRYLGSRYK